MEVASRFRASFCWPLPPTKDTGSHTGKASESKHIKTILVSFIWVGILPAKDYAQSICRKNATANQTCVPRFLRVWAALDLDIAILQQLRLQTCVNFGLYYNPIGSMYGLFTYIWLQFMINVGTYTINGSFGNQFQTFFNINRRMLLPKVPWSSRTWRNWFANGSPFKRNASRTGDDVWICIWWLHFLDGIHPMKGYYWDVHDT